MSYGPLNEIKWGAQELAGGLSYEIGLSLESISISGKLLAEKILCFIITTYSRLDKLSPDDATLPPVAFLLPDSSVRHLLNFTLQ